VHQQLVTILNSSDTPNHLSTYFSDLYGRHFEAIGSAHSSPHRVTADDLVAVQMLSVTIPPLVSADLLLGSLGTELGVLLQRIPFDVDLRSPAALELIEANSPADKAWQLVRAQDGMGRTKTSKLLARKRPALLPVIDEVVACALEEPSNFWVALHTALSSGDFDEALASLRRAGGVPDTVTDLRVIDVAVWSSHKDAHRKCRLRTGRGSQV